MHLKRDIKCDNQQEPKKGIWDIRCPKCNRLQGVLNELHGIVNLRFKCPRCGTFVIANMELSGTGSEQ